MKENNESLRSHRGRRQTLQ